MFIKSESNNAVVTTLKNVRKHPNADKLQLATVLGDTVIVGLESKEDDLIIYFDSNLKLSKSFLYNNNLYSDKTKNKDTNIRGYFPNSGKVKAQLFRGEKSYGFVAYPEMFNYIRKDIAFLDKLEFNKIDNTEICCKYILNVSSCKLNIKNIKKVPSLFKEHWDTKQFIRNIDNIPSNRLLYIEEKLHGTSGRIALTQKQKSKSVIRTFLNKLKFDINENQYEYFNGTRRTLLSTDNKDYVNNVREIIFEKIKPNLKKNEQLYFEIVGYDTNGQEIQSGFPYGCRIGEYKAFLYRISINQDDNIYEMNREYVYNRAIELGFDTPPLFERYYFIGNKEELISKVELYSKNQSVIDNNTLKEGVVIWYEDFNGKWTCLKYKSFEFLKKESEQLDKNILDIEAIS